MYVQEILCLLIFKKIPWSISCKLVFPQLVLSLSGCGNVGEGKELGGEEREDWVWDRAGRPVSPPGPESTTQASAVLYPLNSTQYWVQIWRDPLQAMELDMGKGSISSLICRLQHLPWSHRMPHRNSEPVVVVGLRIRLLISFINWLTVICAEVKKKSLKYVMSHLKCRSR